MLWFSQPVEGLRFETIVPADPSTVFRRFTIELSGWWPRAFTWSGEQLLVDIGMQPGPGGHLYEIGPHGLRLDWGRVLTWRQPEQVAFSWQIGPDRVPQPDADRATEVDVRFTAAGTGTVVVLSHDGWERHGEQGAVYRAGMATAWPRALEQFTRYGDGR